MKRLGEMIGRVLWWTALVGVAVFFASILYGLAVYTWAYGVNCTDEYLPLKDGVRDHVACHPEARLQAVDGGFACICEREAE